MPQEWLSTPVCSPSPSSSSSSSSNKPSLIPPPANGSRFRRHFRAESRSALVRPYRPRLMGATDVSKRPYVFTSLLPSVRIYIPPIFPASSAKVIPFYLYLGVSREWIAKALKWNWWHRSVFLFAIKAGYLIRFLYVNLLLDRALKCYKLNLSIISLIVREKDGKMRSYEDRHNRVNEWNCVSDYCTTFILNDVTSFSLHIISFFLLYHFKNHRFKTDNFIVL